MADTKVSAMTNASTLTGVEETHVTQGGADRAASIDQIKDWVENALVFAAGTASANTWPKLTAGTLLTTAEVGALELDADALYATTDAGNRGYVPVRHLIRANATNTLTSSTAEQKLFASPTNGRLTLETGTYLFESIIYLSAMSATSGNAAFDPLGAGTAVCGDWLYQIMGNDLAAGANPAAAGGAVHIIQQTTAAMVAAGTATGLGFRASGTFTVTTAGTLIPSITLATAAAAIVAIGSYFSCGRIGSTSMVSVGQWD